MKDNSFYNKIHRLGRITVVCALISFMAVPFGLAAVNGISMNIPQPEAPAPMSLRSSPLRHPHS